MSIRNELSRWSMRLLQASRVLRLPLLGVTAVSTLTTALRGTYAEDYTLFIVSAFGLGSLLFIWAYDYFRVLNLENRHKQDRSDNFVGPGFAMNKIMMAHQLSIMAEGIREEKDPEQIEEEMLEKTYQVLRQWRDGIDLEDVYGDGA